MFNVDASLIRNFNNDYRSNFIDIVDHLMHPMTILIIMVIITLFRFHRCVSNANIFKTTSYMNIFQQIFSKNKFIMKSQTYSVNMLFLSQTLLFVIQVCFSKGTNESLKRLFNHSYNGWIASYYINFFYKNNSQLVDMFNKANKITSNWLFRDTKLWF